MYQTVVLRRSTMQKLLHRQRRCVALDALGN
jgi:hypothetical protein